MVGWRHSSRYNELWTQREENRYGREEYGRENPQSTQLRDLIGVVQGEE